MNQPSHHFPNLSPRTRRGVSRFGLAAALALLAGTSALCLALAFHRAAITEAVSLRPATRLEWVRTEDGGTYCRLSDVVRVTFRRGGGSARLTTGAYESAESAADPDLVACLRRCLREDPEQWVPIDLTGDEEYDEGYVNLARVSSLDAANFLAHPCGSNAARGISLEARDGRFVWVAGTVTDPATVRRLGEE